MTCPGCFSADVLSIPFSYCTFCGRLTTVADIQRFHQEILAPRKRIEDELLDLALREGGG